jgi:hypothetical protein
MDRIRSYEPRTYIPPRKDQAPPLGGNLLKPIWEIIRGEYIAMTSSILAYKDVIYPTTNSSNTHITLHHFASLWFIYRLPADPEEIIKKNGVDPYVFVRFLMMMAKAMIPIWILSWLILLPIDSAGSTVDGKTGLDKFTFGNVATNKQARYWAHLIMDYVFIGECYLPCQDVSRSWMSLFEGGEDLNGVKS